MKVLRYLAPHKGVVIGILALLVVQAVCDLMLPTLTASLVDVGIQSAVVSGAEPDFSYLMSIGVQMVGVTAVGALASVVISYFASRTGARIGCDLRGKLFSKVISFSRTEVQRFSAASLITRATNDVQQIQMISIILLRVVLFSPILAIGGIVMVATTAPQMGWIAVTAVVATFAFIGVLFAIALPKFRIVQSLIDKVNLVAHEALTGIPVVRAFNRQKHEEQRFEAANDDLMRTQLFTNRVMAFLRPSTMLVMNTTSCLIVWVAAGFIAEGTLQTGQMIAFITYTMLIVVGFMMMSMVIMLLPRAEISAGRINEVLECEPVVTDPADPKDAELSREGGARISFEDVSFSFDASSEPALKNISFTVEPGQTVGVIGPTGSGKSTVLHLITRAYDATEGAVKIDGINVADLTLDCLHTQLGYVPQRAFLFAGTIAENVAYGLEDADEESIERALRIAQAWDFVNDLGGLQTEVSQGGTNVSGGQRQRLAIARAVAVPARAFLFDDAFSALDYSTDAALRQALARELAGKTQIIVAQRISTIRHADKIVVLDEGEVVGIGTHDELLESCATYSDIAASQLTRDELESPVHHTPPSEVKTKEVTNERLS